MNYENNYKLQTGGSMTDLLNRTGENILPYRKYAERLHASSNIFVPETPNYTRQKQIVPLDAMKLCNKYAGSKSTQMDEVKFFNQTNFM